jgi:hypothetical protein
MNPVAEIDCIMVLPVVHNFLFNTIFVNVYVNLYISFDWKIRIGDIQSISGCWNG